jgi:hypothetical protein
MGGQLEDYDRYVAGLEIARTMPGWPRVAVLARPENINKFGENVAVNWGADLLVTHDRDEAVSFLLLGRIGLRDFKQNFACLFYARLHSNNT